MEKIGAIGVGTAIRTYGKHPPARNVKYLIRKPQMTQIYAD
jgi:hypothetical protein